MIIMILSVSWNSAPSHINTAVEQKEGELSSHKKYLPHWAMNLHIVAGHQARQYLQVSNSINISFALEVLKELLLSRGYCGAIVKGQRIKICRNV